MKTVLNKQAKPVDTYKVQYIAVVLRRVRDGEDGALYVREFKCDQVFTEKDKNIQLLVDASYESLSLP